MIYRILGVKQSIDYSKPSLKKTFLIQQIGNNKSFSVLVTVNVVFELYHYRKKYSYSGKDLTFVVVRLKISSDGN